MKPSELPSDHQGGVVTSKRRLTLSHGAAGWLNYFLTVLSVLLPGYSFVLVYLGKHIRDFAPTLLVRLLIILYIALVAVLIHTWHLTRRFPARGAVALVLSLLLLPWIVLSITIVP